jgi:hypothetical protein
LSNSLWIVAVVQGKRAKRSSNISKSDADNVFPPAGQRSLWPRFATQSTTSAFSHASAQITAYHS